MPSDEIRGWSPVRRQGYAPTLPSPQSARKLNGRQRRRRLRFIYLNGGPVRPSERVQRAPGIVAAKIGAAGRASPAGLGIRPRQPEKDKTMLRKFAVALVAASVLTAPAFAQGNSATAAPRVKTETKSDSATPRVVNA